MGGGLKNRRFEKEGIGTTELKNKEKRINIE